MKDYSAFFKENKEKFLWSDHTFMHYSQHKILEKEIRRQYLLNHQFAKKYKINVEKHYAVSPKHSGVYPIYPSLYKIWNENGIKATR
jgi:hypothetical protein